MTLSHPMTRYDTTCHLFSFLPYIALCFNVHIMIGKQEKVAKVKEFLMQESYLKKALDEVDNEIKVGLRKTVKSYTSIE